MRLRKRQSRSDVVARINAYTVPRPFPMVELRDRNGRVIAYLPMRVL